MNFLEALQVVVEVIREQQDELDEIYFYEPSSQTQLYLKNEVRAQKRQCLVYTNYPKMRK